MRVTKMRRLDLGLLDDFTPVVPMPDPLPPPPEDKPRWSHKTWIDVHDVEAIMCTWEAMLELSDDSSSKWKATLDSIGISELRRHTRVIGVAIRRGWEVHNGSTRYPSEFESVFVINVLIMIEVDSTPAEIEKACGIEIQEAMEY